MAETSAQPVHIKRLAVVSGGLPVLGARDALPWAHL